MTDNETLETPETPETELKPEDEATEATETAAVAAADVAEETEEGEENKVTFVEDPIFEIDYKGDCAYEVKVSIPTSNEKKQTEEMFEELSHEAELPGFRRGRAPRRLLEKKLGKHVQKEVEQKLVTAAFEKLCKDHSLRPIGALDIDGLDEDTERAAGTPLAFTLKFEVGPKAELGTYRGLEIERPVLKVTEDDIAKTVEGMRTRYALYETLEEGAAQEGDQVIIDFHGAIDGAEFPGNKAENYPYILGTKRFFQEFEDILVGSKTGDVLKCDVTFPASYHNKDLCGKTAAFEITVNEIKRKNVPELDDALAKQFGYENLQVLHEKVGEELRGRMMAQSNSVAAARAIDAVVAVSTFEFPKSLIKSMTEEAYEEEVNRLRKMHVPHADIQAQETELRQKAETDTINTLKSIVALNEIAEAEGIEVTDEDFEREAAHIGERYGVAADQVTSLITEEGRRGTYELRILREKASALLLEYAKITDKEVSSSELEDEHEAAALDDVDE